MTSLRILIAEDNLDISDNLGDFLETNGHQVDYAYDGKMAVSLCEELVFDAIIIDVMMPKLDGFEATAAIRKSGQANAVIPILMLTAKDTLDDKLEGFDSGADDYILKPFALAEVYARLLAQVRKLHKDYQSTYQLGKLSFDQVEKTAQYQDCNIKLNPTTYKILLSLAKKSPKLVPKSELEFQLWGDLKPDTDLLRSHIYNLRKSLNVLGDKVTIEAKHGQGYKLILND